MKSRARICALLTVPALLYGSSPADCISCHRFEAQSQPRTSMGHAMDSAAGCDILRDNPKLDFREDNYSYRISRDGNRSIYTVSDAKNTLTVPISWAFGLGAAGQTYLYQLNGRWYESRVSFFRQLHGLDLTMGAGATSPRNLEEAAGRLMSVKDTVECFGCHATNAVGGGLVGTELKPGVQCERCHESAEKHMAAFKSGDLREAGMRRLGKLSTEDISNFCGQCHRSWAQIAMEGPLDVNNVRFQPYRLTNSKCYDTSDARISCVACHDPHRGVEHAHEFYDAKCQACHAIGGQTSVAAGGKPAKPCRTANNDCVRCHMPKYEIPGSHNYFTDHYIRIVRTREPYPA